MFFHNAAPILSELDLLIKHTKKKFANLRFMIKNVWYERVRWAAKQQMNRLSTYLAMQQGIDLHTRRQGNPSGSSPIFLNDSFFDKCFFQTKQVTMRRSSMYKIHTLSKNWAHAPKCKSNQHQNRKRDKVFPMPTSENCQTFTKKVDKLVEFWFQWLSQPHRDRDKTFQRSQKFR